MNQPQKITLTLICFLLLINCSEEKISGDPAPPDDDNSPVVFTPKDHPIKIKNVNGKAVFWNNDVNQLFIPRGVNYFWILLANGEFQDRFFGVGIFDQERVRADFRKLKENGYNVIRLFIDSCNDDPICIGNFDNPGLNGAYIDNLVKTMEIAKEEGIHLMLTSNDLPGQGGYWDLSNEGVSDQFAGYRNAHYLTSKGVQSAIKYWGDLFKALSDRNASFESVFAWSLLNEQWYFNDQVPFSLTSGMVKCANGNSYDMSSQSEKKSMAIESIIYYIDQIRKVIDEFDPNALVTMGFFVPDYPNPMRQGDFRYVETAGLLQDAQLDFFDFHAYPGWDPIEKIAENFGMIGYTSKPVIMGEAGAFIEKYPVLSNATKALQGWIAESCALGFGGWIYWGMYQAPIAIGDATWGFMDEQKEMLEALSPINYPDACSEDLLPPENIALNKTVSASNSLSDQKSKNAVDGNYSTQWGSGDDAPQWIKIDLGQDYPISKINLHVAQWPEGNTKHKLEAKSNTGDWVTLKTFSGNTKEGDVLIYQAAGGGDMYRYIKVTTTASPSWIAWNEIEVFN